MENFYGRKETVREPYRMVLEGGQAELVEKKCALSQTSVRSNPKQAVAVIDEKEEKILGRPA